MPTTKKRINITTNQFVSHALKEAARRDKVPVATKASELLELALEIEEDLYFTKLAEQRLKGESLRWISHSEFWKNV